MPIAELRRLRKNKNIRNWVSQHELRPKDIILPYFLVEGKNVKKPITSMPGIYHLSVDNLTKDIGEIKGLHSVLLFGVSNEKDNQAKNSYRKNGIVQKAIKAIKKEFKDLIIISDVCLCGYTAHGHCGIVKNQKSRIKDPCLPHRKEKYYQKLKNFEIDNDKTLKILVRIALSQAQAGADFVAPSAMMDGQVRAIRQTLDKKGFKDTGILAYSAKYASCFYGPFREALDSKPAFGDRKTYQMDFRNSYQALREIKQDIDEGADIVMIKPALAYLDIIYRARQEFNIPIAAYNVSGEYSMIKKLNDRDKNAQKELALEVLTSIKRAGADLIITYWAKDLLKWLK